MWAQLIKAKVKPGKEEELQEIYQELMSITKPGQGFIRATTARDRKDSSVRYTFVLFESEEKARVRESSPELVAVSSKFANVFEGPPEFVDLEVVDDVSV